MQPSSQRSSQLMGFNERISLALAGIQRLPLLFFAVISQDLLVFPQLHLSNTEEVLVYFCLLLESEHTAGSDSHPDQMRPPVWPKKCEENTFGTKIFIRHNCLMRSMKPEESLMLHIIVIKPTGWDGQTSSPGYPNIEIFLCPLNAYLLI